MKYVKGNDIKVKVSMYLDGEVVSPTTVPFEVALWTNSKLTAIKAGWDGSATYGGATIDDDYVQISADADPRWWSGDLYGEATLYYPDATMPDNVYQVIASLEFDESGVSVVEHTVYGLSAYDLAVSRGYVGTLDSWLASLKGADASTDSYEYDAEGNTIITWADGKKTTVKRGVKGDNGYTPIKGVDYFDGADGYTPVKGVDYFDGADGAPGKDGIDGVDGQPGGMLWPKFVTDAEAGTLTISDDGGHISVIDGYLVINDD